MADDTPICLDVQTICRKLGVSEWTVRAWVKSGALRAMQFPSLDGSAKNRRILVHVADFETFVAAHRGTAS